MRWQDIFSRLPDKARDTSKRRLVYYFSALPGYVVSHEELHDLLYGGDKYMDKMPNISDLTAQHIYHVRKYLKPEWTILALCSDRGFILERTERVKRYLGATPKFNNKTNSARINNAKGRAVKALARRYFGKSCKRTDF